MADTNKAAWDVGRFIQTLGYFEAVPIVSWVQKMFMGATPPLPPQTQAGMVFDFRNGTATSALGQVWGALDDVVMGGVSQSGIQATPEGALFAGVVSTANSGGFASVRTRNFEPPLNLAGHQGLELRVKGDGQRYKFLIRDADPWDSVAYAYSFPTTLEQWITVRIPFNELVPVFRAKTVQNAIPLRTSRIYSLQLMLSKFEYDGLLNPVFKPGNFTLLVQSIGVY